MKQKSIIRNLSRIFLTVTLTVLFVVDAFSQLPDILLIDKAGKWGYPR